MRTNCVAAALWLCLAAAMVAQGITGGGLVNTIINVNGSACALGSSCTLTPGTGGNPQQYISWGPGAIPDGTTKTLAFAFPAAVLGTPLKPAIPVLAAGLTCSIAVTASGLVTISVTNMSGASVTVGTLIWGAEVTL